MCNSTRTSRDKHTWSRTGIQCLANCGSTGRQTACRKSLGLALVFFFPHIKDHTLQMQCCVTKTANNQLSHHQNQQMFVLKRRSVSILATHTTHNQMLLKEDPHRHGRPTLRETRGMSTSGLASWTCWYAPKKECVPGAFFLHPSKHRKRCNPRKHAIVARTGPPTLRRHSRRRFPCCRCHRVSPRRDGVWLWCGGEYLY